MRKLSWFVALLATVTLALPARAQPFDPDGVLLEELVVTARDLGPAFWTVRDADTVVYVLGTPSLAPKRMQWDQSVFMRRLRGANVVILPARGTRVRVLSAPKAAISYLKLKSSTPYEARLSASDQARFVAAREALGQEAKHYPTRNSLAAGLIMFADYRERHSLTDSDPTKLIRLLATQNGVKVQARTYDIAPLLGALVKVPESAGRICLEAVLDQVAAGPARTLAATRAWAEGDVRGALGQERVYKSCLNAAPGAAAWDARTKADQAAQIAQALKTPGHAIAVVQLRPLLAQGGVLDRLRAQGFEVAAPGQMAEPD